MEENKSKNGAGVVVLLIMAVIVIAVLGALIYVLQTNNNKDVATGNVNNSEQTINALKSEIDSLKNTITQKENEIKNYENKEPVIQTKEMTSNEKYKIFARNLKKEVSEYGNTTNSKSTYCRFDSENDGRNGSWYQVSLQSNGNLSLSIGDEELNAKYGTKSLVKNVLAFYIIDVGQDEWHSIYFINEDGTVGSAYVDPVIFNGTGKIEIKKNISTRLKNIVSIINGTTGNGYCPLFIDIDGNVIDINK